MRSHQDIGLHGQNLRPVSCEQGVSLLAACPFWMVSRGRQKEANHFESCHQKDPAHQILCLSFWRAAPFLGKSKRPTTNGPMCNTDRDRQTDSQTHTHTSIGHGS